MSNSRWSAFNSGQANQFQSKTGQEVKAWVHEISSPEEREEYIERFKLGKEFDMRHRALVHFYGADLIAYKRKHRSSKQVNEFLRTFSRYLTHHLEDDCPPSWKAYQLHFWEELIFAYFPNQMKLSTKQNESMIFLTQLKKFVYWLDQHTGCTWFDIVEKLADEALLELKTCECLLNGLILHLYPEIHQKNWNMRADMERIDHNFNACSKTVDSIFEIKQIAGDIITVKDIDTKLTYQITDFPVKGLTIGILLDGIIGKTDDDFYWSWHLTLGLYPQKGKKYIKFMD